MPATATSPLAAELAEPALERLDRYARIDTTADRHSGTRPSSRGQFELLDLLRGELEGLGLADVSRDDRGFLFATLAGNTDGAPVVGLLAHVDTSPDAPGAGVEPLVHRDYDGGVIALPRGGTVLDPETMPELRDKLGHDIVTSSGDTLLGADDKAGVAEIMAAVAHLVAHPELPRPTLRIGFTPDEEIGAEGALELDIERFGAHCAYTLDGSELGEFQTETFNASEARVTFTGVDVHPGHANGKLVNSTRLAGRFLDRLPAELTPERTSGHEGFVHAIRVEGSPGRTTIELILRDFDPERLAAHEALVRELAASVVASEPRAGADIDIRPQYPNMRTYLDRDPRIAAAAEEAIRRAGIEPRLVPVRGGTDGSILSSRGLPTPNIFTGGHEFHSVREWASVDDMGAAAAVVVRLAEVWAEA
ncbi:peptidase T [Thermoleophilia bacterium SCSIO 60948]|nr:peptidase T [Thermoleophilia bacterium SCSIO 60948]